ncbi:methyltransferase domain-containing protein [Micromonospora endolithica]|uniref:Methyltransferase domain-containing protein n=1 Tax=Micromonospora endolithica TaxID=230091 RepID=A0A3A9ZQA2_9ACTN|nr:methyltransferase domain-containing protein [Micromonospora endolithica]RKN50458.1 methyltransferase domain-containing protein [Micromonospora endolithica]TWJ20856.1 methyltransferase family protein [Micromonospora endolithica]
MTTTPHRYQFRNTPGQLHPLQEMLDPITIDDLKRCGVTPGQHALDVGAGAGSIARHLCHLVGPTGKVIAVDLDTTLLAPTGVLDVYQRDLRTEPLPAEPGSLHLVTARCVLEHLPTRHQVLQQMITALRPGGQIVLGDIVYARTTVPHAPTDGDAELITRVVHGILDILAGRGVDLHWGEKTPTLLLNAGLDQVHTRWTARTWTGGSPGCRLYADNARHLRDQLLTAGFTAADLDRFGELMTHPAVMMRGYEFATSTARKPH